MQAKNKSETVDVAVTAKELARMLRVSVKHVRNLASKRELPAPLKLGRSCRWLLSEIEAFLVNKKQPIKEGKK